MRNFVVPKNTPRGVSEALRQIRLALQDLDAPLLSKKSSITGITEGTSAYFLDGKTLCRYTKVKSKLYKECIGDVDTPTRTGDAGITYSSKF